MIGRGEGCEIGAKPKIIEDEICKSAGRERVSNALQSILGRKNYKAAIKNL